MKGLTTRFTIGVVFALPLMLLSFALAQATPPTQPVTPVKGNCQACHEDFQKAWEAGAHGRATVDPAFKTAWEAQGSPEKCLACHTTGYDPNTGAYEAEGVTCEACHSPVTDNHPAEPMPTDRSAGACGKCHTETFFDWQVSAHRKNDLTCVGCHDPHATKLKAESPSALCATCHRERASNFAHTQHSQQGLTCADCHLGQMADALNGEGHAVRDHSFNVRLSTCNECHAYQMHDPASVHTDQPTPQPPDAMAAVETMGVSAEPQPVSPVGFAVISGLLGFGAGLVVAPWIERWYRRMGRFDK